MTVENPNATWGKTYSLQAFMKLHGIMADTMQTVKYLTKPTDGSEPKQGVMLTYSSATEEDGRIPCCSDISVNDKNQLVDPETQAVLAANNVRVSECTITDPLTQDSSTVCLLHRYYPAKSGQKCSLFE